MSDDIPSVADVKGRLLTPEEGCGFSKVQHKRIIGGSIAQIGNERRLSICTSLKRRETNNLNLKYNNFDQ